MEKRTRSFLQLIKPGITLSNTMTTAAGGLLGVSVMGWHVAALLGGIVGTALIIASACVFNNIIDRDIDARMKRTQRREVASGKIAVPIAASYSALLGVAGFVILVFTTNWLTALLGLVAYIWYVGIYGVAKRTTFLSTVIGGVAGALPPVAGYTALTNRIDMTAVGLFVILFLWQLPHFYAIAIFRRDDYTQAKLPVWSVRFGFRSTRFQIVGWTVLYALAVPSLFLAGSVGRIYLILATAFALYWVATAVSKWREPDERWARQVFGASLLVLLATSSLIAIGGFLP